MMIIPTLQHYIIYVYRSGEGDGEGEGEGGGTGLAKGDSLRLRLSVWRLLWLRSPYDTDGKLVD